MISTGYRDEEEIGLHRTSHLFANLLCQLFAICKSDQCRQRLELKTCHKLSSSALLAKNLQVQDSMASSEASNNCRILSRTSVGTSMNENPAGVPSPIVYLVCAIKEMSKQLS